MPDTTFDPAPIKESISLEEINRIDIRVGTIVSIEDIDGSETLMRLTVDFGDHLRTIVSGMRNERPDPAVLKNTQALFVVNLEPQSIMGELSEGLLFDIGYADHLPSTIAKPEKPMPNGARCG